MSHAVIIKNAVKKYGDFTALNAKNHYLRYNILCSFY